MGAGATEAGLPNAPIGRTSIAGHTPATPPPAPPLTAGTPCRMML